MSDRCQAITGKHNGGGRRCCFNGSIQIASAFVCGTHAALYEEYRQLLGSGPAMQRIINGVTYNDRKAVIA